MNLEKKNEQVQNLLIEKLAGGKRIPLNQLKEEVCKEVGCSESTFTKGRIRAGVVAKPIYFHGPWECYIPKREKRKGLTAKLSDSNVNVIAEMTKQGITQSQIAKAVNCSLTTIGKYQRELGLDKIRMTTATSFVRNQLTLEEFYQLCELYKRDAGIVPTLHADKLAEKYTEEMGRSVTPANILRAENATGIRSLRYREQSKSEEFSASESELSDLLQRVDELDNTFLSYAKSQSECLRKLSEQLAIAERILSCLCRDLGSDYSELLRRAIAQMEAMEAMEAQKRD